MQPFSDKLNILFSKKESPIVTLPLIRGKRSVESLK
jgi:hypothetical protein